MIYLVDEDLSDVEVYSDIFREEGYETRIIEDADEAYDVLVGATNVQGIILDVMLATGVSQTSRFDSIETNNYTQTGLALAKRLKLAHTESGRPPNYSRIILFSNATENGFLSSIKETVDDLKISYFAKYDETDPFDIASKMLRVIQGWEAQ